MDGSRRCSHLQPYLFTSDDLADQPYRAWFDDGMSPEEAADETLSNEGWFDNGLFD